MIDRVEKPYIDRHGQVFYFGTGNNRFNFRLVDDKVEVPYSSPDHLRVVADGGKAPVYSKEKDQPQSDAEALEETGIFNKDRFKEETIRLLGTLPLDWFDQPKPLADHRAA